VVWRLLTQRGKNRKNLFDFSANHFDGTDCSGDRSSNGWQQVRRNMDADGAENNGQTTPG
jgi:hypothetical protein